MRVYLSFSAGMNNLRGRMKINGMRFCRILRIEYQQIRMATYKRGIEVGQSIAGGSLEKVSFAATIDTLYSYLKNVD